jgi:multidrug efflux system membrane fusion protein
MQVNNSQNSGNFDRKLHGGKAPHKLRWLGLAGVIGLAAALSFGLRGVHAQGARPQGRAGGAMAVPVVAAAARRGIMPVYLEGLGSVTPFYTVTVHTRVDGQLMEVAFREGQEVRAGDLLAEIDPRPFQVQLEQAQGQLAHDEAVLDNARVDLERYRNLLEQEAIPKQQLDTQAALVAQEEGTIKADQAAIDNAKLQLTYCHITAPISGRIGLRLVDPGNMVHASDPNGMLVITQMHPITVVFTLPEDSLAPVLRKVRDGAALPVEAYNRDKTQKLASGRLLTTDNQIDPNTGTLKLKAVFENREDTLFPNQFVNVRMLVDAKRGQVIVPVAAIQRGSQGTFVYVVKPDKTVEARPISVGIVAGNNASIEKGLEAGEMVVTDGADKLQPGSRVTAVTDRGGPAA